MTRTFSLRLAASALTLVAAAACSSGPDPTAGSPSAGSSVPASPSDAGSGSVRGTGSPSHTATITSSETPAPPPPPPGEAPQSAPPAPGTYRYRQDGETSAGTLSFDAPAEGALEVEPATIAKGGQRQRQVREVSPNQKTEQTFLFTPSAIYLEEATQGRIECAPKPKLLVAPLPLRVGRSWESGATCDGITLTLEAKVLRTERRAVGSRTVSTFVVHSVRTTAGSGFTITTEADTWFSPAYRLIVRQVQHGEGSFQGTPFTEDLTEDLVGLSPE